MGPEIDWCHWLNIDHYCCWTSIQIDSVLISLHEIKFFLKIHKFYHCHPRHLIMKPWRKHWVDWERGSVTSWSRLSFYQINSYQGRRVFMRNTLRENHLHIQCLFWKLNQNIFPQYLFFSKILQYYLFKSLTIH